jgi:hypothetical protein
MDNNNNLHRGRGIPFQQRRGPIFECRECHGFFSQIRRHEGLCNGPHKPYRCPVCRVSFTCPRRARRHFQDKHPEEQMPRNFHNPLYRHETVVAHQAPNPANPPQPPAPQAEAAAAEGPPQPLVAPAEAQADAAADEGPPQPPLAPAEAVAEVPPPEHQPMVVDVVPQPEVEAQHQLPMVADVVPQPEVEAQHQPPVEAEPQPQVDAQEFVLPFFEVLEVQMGNVPAAAPQQGLGHAAAPPQVGWLNEPPQIGALLAANLAANLRQARNVLGSDLLVIQLVTQVLGDPGLYQL